MRYAAEMVVLLMNHHSGQLGSLYTWFLYFKYPRVLPFQIFASVDRFSASLTCMRWHSLQVDPAASLGGSYRESLLRHGRIQNGRLRLTVGFQAYLGSCNFLEWVANTGLSMQTSNNHDE